MYRIEKIIISLNNIYFVSYSSQHDAHCQLFPVSVYHLLQSQCDWFLVCFLCKDHWLAFNKYRYFFSWRECQPFHHHVTCLVMMRVDVWVMAYHICSMANGSRIKFVLICFYYIFESDSHHYCTGQIPDLQFDGLLF